MKRFLLYFLAFAPLCSFAQITTGYYRVMNDYTKRYMSIVDTNADFKIDLSAPNKVVADLRAIHMLTGFEDSVAYNPATICFIEHISGTRHNLSGQGLDLYETTGRLLDATQTPSGLYRIYAEESGITKYLIDNSYYGTRYFPSIGDANTTNTNRNWHILSVDQSADSYFGVKPDIQATADGSYWATQYAGFPFKPSDASTKVYTVCDVDNARGYAVIREISGNVPAQTPVLFHCGAATPSGNKMTLLPPGTSANTGTNYLEGNYYCNDVVADADPTKNHRNVKAYDPLNMRVLDVDSKGKPAFVKGNDANLIKSKVDGKLYIPANKAYLAVSPSAPDVLQIITEEDYITGIHEINTSTTDGTKVIYDLQGRRVQAPSKGLYIVNGKKMIIR